MTAGSKRVDGVDGVSERAEVVIVVDVGRQGQVEGGAGASSCSCLLRVAREVGIGPVGVAVHRHVLHIVPLVEDLLGAVAVVVVDVEHGHLGPRRRGDRVSGDAGIVEIAITPVRSRRGVVAGRPAESVGRGLAAQHQIGRGEGHVDRPPGRLVGAFDERRHRLEAPEAEAGRRPAGAGAGPIPARSAGCTTVSGMASVTPCSRCTSSHAVPRKATSPGSWTASMGPTPWLAGSTRRKRSGAPASARWISSARAGSPVLRHRLASSTSSVGACRRWSGDQTAGITVPSSRAVRPTARSARLVPSRPRGAC